MDENEKNLKNEEKDYLFKMIYLIRTNLPSSELVYIIMFILKYLSLILFSISLNEWNSDKNVSGKNDVKDIMHMILSKFLISGNGLNFINKNYQEICILGFGILLFFILLLIIGFIHIRKKYYVKNLGSWEDKKIKKIDKNSLFQNYLFKILAYFFFLISFFHQYIIEYYFFGFLGITLYTFGVYESSSDFIDPIYYSHMENYYNHINISPFHTIIINLLTIIIVFILSNFFLIINSTKTLFFENGIPFYGNKKSLLIKIIIYNFQPLYGLINSFKSDMKLKIAIVFLSIFFVIVLLDIILTFYNFSFYPSLLNYICTFLEFFILFSSFIELIIYLTESRIYAQKFNYIKLCAELLNSSIFTFLFYQQKIQRSSRIFSDNLFNKSFKTLNPDDIYAYIKSYLKYVENPEVNYILLFKLIQNHLLSCHNPECSGKKLIPKEMLYSIFTDFEKLNDYLKNTTTIEDKNYNYSNRLFSEKSLRSKINLSEYKDNKTIKENSDINKKYSIKNKITEERKNLSNYKSKSSMSIKHINIIKNIKVASEQNINIENNKDEEKDNGMRRLTNDEFQIIGEQEIINRINYLNESKNYDILEIYIFIHLQFLIKIKQNYRLALYFVSKYSLSEIKLSFLSRYFLYEIKKYICKSIFSLNKISLIKDPYILKYKEENIIMKKLINYFKYAYIIKRLLCICCEKINFYFKFRGDLHNSLFLQKYNKTKIIPIINAAEETKSSIYKLELLIDKIYNKQKKMIESIEISYLICNFFKLINGNISEEFLQKITPIFYFKQKHLEQLNNEFQQYMISNPLIISLSRNDTFIIRHFNNIFIEKLGYITKDLINKDFHKQLFPGGKELIKEHSFLLKQFLFFYKNEYVKNRTFLKSKEGYLVSIDFICKIFPNFDNDFYLIANITFNDDLNKNNFSINNNKSDKFNENNKMIMNKYSFFLSSDFEIYSLSKNFYLEFDLNQNMIRELRINFCQFFSIDENKLTAQIYKEKTKLFKKYPYLNHRKYLRESNKAYTIFQNIKIENIFKLRDKKLLENYFFPTIYISDKIDKNKVIKKIPEMLAIIDEIGLDYEWYLRLENFKERLTYSDGFENLKNNNENTNQIISDEKRDSNLIDINSIKNNYNPFQFFQVTYSLKRLGSINFYIVNLEEILNINNIGKNKIRKEEDFTTNRSSKTSNTINNTNRKINSKKTITFKSIEKVKSKVSFQESVIKNKNVSNNQILEIPIENDKNSKNIMKKTLGLEKDINKLKKNSEENEKEKINLKGKKTIYYDNTEYIKKNKRNKKENNEDDENSPLITKEEINEILKKNNKRNKVLLIILFLIIIITFLLAIIKLLYGLFVSGNAMNVLNSAIYIEMLKVDIYVEALLSIIYCVYENDNIMEIQQIQSVAQDKIKDILDHLNLFQDNVNIILNDKKTLNIFKVIEERFLRNMLTDDWKIINKTVDILEEIRRLSYALYSLSTTRYECNINKFYLFSELNFNFEGQNIENCNEMQKIFFYFANNVLTNYQLTFDKLTEECIISLGYLWDNYSTIFYYLLYIIISLLFIFCIIYIIKLSNDYTYYELLFLYYYNIENDQLEFENKIYHFHKTILEFNYDNIKYFEYIKINSKDLDFNDDLKKTFSKFYKTEKNKNDIDIDNSFQYNDSSKKKLSISKNNKEFQQFFKAFESASMNGNILNDSINGSSIQLLNNHNNNNHSLNNKSLTPNISKEKNKENISEEESLESKMKSLKKILPNSLKYSFFFLFIFVLFFASLSAINIYILNTEYNNWDFGINISINLLEVIPQMMGTIIYACLSIILNRINLIEGSAFTIAQPKYLKMFESKSLYYSEDIMKKNFNNSYYGKLLRDNLRISYNLDNYLNINNFFSNTNKWETLLNTAGYFCIYANMGDLLSKKVNIESNFSIYNFIKEIESKALNCTKEHEIINENGIKLEIKYILEEITNKYIEFINYKELNKTLKESRESFFKSKSIKLILVEIQYSFILYFNTIIHAINLDFDNFNKNIEIEENLLSIFIIIINFAFLIILICIIIKIEGHKRLFAYFANIPKNN